MYNIIGMHKQVPFKITRNKRARAHYAPFPIYFRIPCIESESLHILHLHTNVSTGLFTIYHLFNYNIMLLFYFYSIIPSVSNECVVIQNIVIMRFNSRVDIEWDFTIQYFYEICLQTMPLPCGKEVDTRFD